MNYKKVFTISTSADITAINCVLVNSFHPLRQQLGLVLFDHQTISIYSFNMRLQTSFCTCSFFSLWYFETVRQKPQIIHLSHAMQKPFWKTVNNKDVSENIFVWPITSRKNSLTCNLFFIITNFSTMTYLHLFPRTLNRLSSITRSFIKNNFFCKNKKTNYFKQLFSF